MRNKRVHPKPKPGQTLGHWTTIKEMPSVRSRAYWLAQCVCGSVVEVLEISLASGRSKSCGCFGQSSAALTPSLRTNRAHRAWQSVLGQCNNLYNVNYPEYGAKGVKVPESWARFEDFVKDVRVPPFWPAILVRKDSSQNFSRENCEWTRAPEIEFTNHKVANVCP